MGRAQLRSCSPAARTAATCAGAPRAPPGPIFLRHLLPASRLPWDPELREPVPPGPAAPARPHRGGYQTGRPHLDHYRRPGPSPPRLACLAGRPGRAGPGSPGAAYVVTGPGEQPLPGLAGAWPGHRHRRGRPGAWRPGGMDGRGRPGGARLRGVGRGDRPAGGRPPQRGAGPGRDLARPAVGAFRRRLPARPPCWMMRRLVTAGPMTQRHRTLASCYPWRRFPFTQTDAGPAIVSDAIPP